jgi:Protein of unknown function (DUF998)
MVASGNVTCVSQARKLASRVVPEPAPGRTVPGWVIASAALSPAVMTVGWLVADMLQPRSYSPVRQTVSVLAGYAGADRWIVTSALFLVGGLHFVMAAGLTGLSGRARLLLVLAGACSIGIAASPEPAHGSTPQHLAWTALGAVVITAWPAFTARRAPRGPLILSPAGTAAVTAAFAALLGWLIYETQGGGDLGVAERLVSSVQISWPFIVAVALRRSSSRASRPGAPGPAAAQSGGHQGREPGPAQLQLAPGGSR